MIPKSKYYDGWAEGIVIKNYCRKAREGNHQLYAKLVRDEFKEDNKAVFGSVRQTTSDTQKITEEFVFGIFKDCLFGITFLVSHGISHGNLKPSNILFSNGLWKVMFSPYIRLWIQ